MYNNINLMRETILKVGSKDTFFEKEKHQSYINFTGQC